MVILELYQGDYQKDLVAFDSLEEGRAFVAQIPGYTLETEDGFEVEYVNPKQLPDYMEIVFNGNIVPFSRFSFNPEENVDIIWKEISNLSVKNDKVIMHNKTPFACSCCKACTVLGDGIFRMINSNAFYIFFRNQA